MVNDSVLSHEQPQTPAADVVQLHDASLAAGLTELRRRVTVPLTRTSPTIVVDIAGLSQLSSGTLSALLVAQRRCRARGGWVVLRGASGRCHDILTRTGLAPLFAQDPAGFVDEDDRRP